MEKIRIHTGGGSGISSDEVTATKADILNSYTALTKDSEDDAGVGSMPERGAASSTIRPNSLSYIGAGHHNGKGVISVSTLAASTIATAVNSDILNGKTGWSNGVQRIGSIPILNGGSVYPTTTNKIVAGSGSLLQNNIIIKGDSNFNESNIKSGVTIFNKTGSFSGYSNTGEQILYEPGNTHGNSFISIPYAYSGYHNDHTGLRWELEGNQCAIKFTNNYMQMEAEPPDQQVGTNSGGGCNMGFGTANAIDLNGWNYLNIEYIDVAGHRMSRNSPMYYILSTYRDIYVGVNKGTPADAFNLTCYKNGFREYNTRTYIYDGNTYLRPEIYNTPVSLDSCRFKRSININCLRASRYLVFGSRIHNTFTASDRQGWRNYYIGFRVYRITLSKVVPSGYSEVKFSYNDWRADVDPAKSTWG